MIARAAFFAGRVATDLATLAHYSGVWMSWVEYRVTVNTPKEVA